MDECPWANAIVSRADDSRPTQANASSPRQSQPAGTTKDESRRDETWHAAASLDDPLELRQRLEEASPFCVQRERTSRWFRPEPQLIRPALHVERSY
jgi:hypothetical protein